MSCFHTASLNSRRVRRALKRIGCQFERAGGRNHPIYIGPSGRRFSVPTGHREISVRALRHGLEQAGVAWDDLLKHY